MNLAENPDLTPKNPRNLNKKAPLFIDIGTSQGYVLDHSLVQLLIHCLIILEFETHTLPNLFCFDNVCGCFELTEFQKHHQPPVFE